MHLRLGLSEGLTLCNGYNSVSHQRSGDQLRYGLNHLLSAMVKNNDVDMI
jgi:hypothetical protein